MSHTNILDGTLENEIFQGFWKNRLSGNVYGVTLTLDRLKGGVLIAFLALYVGATGRSLWKIARFILHCAFSASTATDGPYHQRQAILRNSSLAHEAALALLQSSAAWRRKRKVWAHKSLVVGLFAVILSLALTAMGLWSSKVISADVDEVLLNGQGCGRFVYDLDQNMDGTFAAFSYVRKRHTKDLLNAVQCYGSSTAQSSDSCSVYVKPSLPYRTNTSATCPFLPEICLTKDQNLEMDTGYLDGYADLGINQGPRLRLRQKIHCAPIKTGGYSKVSTDATTNLTYIQYAYLDDIEKTTFLYQTQKKNLTQSSFSNGDGDAGDYRISSFGASNALEDVQLIPALSRLDAETSLYFLDGTQILNRNKTEDLWFKSTTPWLPPDSSSIWFFSDQPWSVVACATTREFCGEPLSAHENCVNVEAKNSSDSLQRVWPRSEDIKIMRPLIAAFAPWGDGSLSQYFKSGLPSLVARTSLFKSFQSMPLASNQWQIEFETVFRASLAGMQAQAVEYARGFWSGQADCTTEIECYRLCSSQKIRNSAYHSFSVIRLAAILVGGALIMILAATLESLIDLVFRWLSLRGKQQLHFAYAEWKSDSTLQLQRLAHEGLGLGTWSEATKTIPLTQTGDQLGVLDISQAKHPKIVQSSMVLQTVASHAQDSKTVRRPHYSQLPSSEQV